MSKLLYFFKQKNLTADNFLLIKQFIKQYVILQVHFEKIWQFEFGKITIWIMSANERFSKQKDIKKITKITQNWVVFFLFLTLHSNVQDTCYLKIYYPYLYIIYRTILRSIYSLYITLSIIYNINTYFLNSSSTMNFICVRSVQILFVKIVQSRSVSLQ